MPLALTEDQHALAETVGRFAQRYATRAATREAFDALAAGELPEHWARLAGQGLLSVHLPEEVGGGGGSLEDAAVVLETAGRELMSGPLLSSITASAVLARAAGGPGRDTWLTRLAGGTPAVLVPTCPGVQAEVTDARVRLTGTSPPLPGALAAEVFVVLLAMDTVDVVALDTTDSTDETGTATTNTNADAGFGAGADEAGAGARIAAVVIDAQANGLTRTSLAATDLTRDCGVVDLDGVVADELYDLDASGAAAVVAALAAAEAAGVMRWSTEAAVE